MRCIKKTAVIIAFLIYSTGFLYAQESEYDLENESRYKITTELRQTTGELHLRINETDAALYLDGIKQGNLFVCFSLGTAAKKNYDGSYTYFEQNSVRGCEWILKIPEGEHIIEIKKFGKKTAVTKVYVFGKTQVELDVSLQDTDFELISFSAEKKRFNPYNPGTLGMCRFNFSVTAPGEGMLEIYGADSRLVYRRSLEPFAAENVHSTWDGRDENGAIVKKGIYTAYLQVRGASGTEFIQSEPLFVAVDTAPSVPLNLFSTSGLSAGLVPTAHLMPKGSLYGASTGSTDFSLSKGFKSAPLFLGFAYTPLEFLELSCTTGTEIKPSRANPLIIQGCLKAVCKSGMFRYGALLGGAYSSGKAASVFNEGILHTGSLLAIDHGPLCIGVSEQVFFGIAGGDLYPLNGNLKTGVSGSFQKGFYAVHLSAVLYSPFSSSGMQGFGRIQAGSDVCVLIPKTLCMPGAGIYYTRDKNGENGFTFRIGVAIYH